MALIDAASLRNDFPFIIQSDVKDSQLAFSIVSASRRLKKWVGDSAYDAPENEDILKNAEGHLVMHYALLGLNTNLRFHGLVKAEQVEGNTVNTYFTPGDTANFVSQYLEMAREIADELITGSDIPPAPEFVEENG